MNSGCCFNASHILLKFENKSTKLFHSLKKSTKTKEKSQQMDVVHNKRRGKTLSGFDLIKRCLFPNLWD
jgi:hypothetical protein